MSSIESTPATSIQDFSSLQNTPLKEYIEDFEMPSIISNSSSLGMETFQPNKKYINSLENLPLTKSYIDIYDKIPQTKSYGLEVKRNQMSNVIYLSGTEQSETPPPPLYPKGMKSLPPLSSNGGVIKLLSTAKEGKGGGESDSGTRDNVILFNGLRIDTRFPTTVMQVQR